MSGRADESLQRGWSWNVTDELKDSPYEVFEQGQGDKHQVWTHTHTQTYTPVRVRVKICV